MSKKSKPKAEAHKQVGVVAGVQHDGPTTGQSQKLDPETRKTLRKNLNPHEDAVLTVLRRSRAADGVTLAELASLAFPSKNKTQGNSWARNALRRLVAGKLVERVQTRGIGGQRASYAVKKARAT